MVFKISDFKSNIGKVARPNLFIATIFVSPEMPVALEVPETFSFRCERASFPGKTLATIDEVSAGPTLKIPYDVTYSDIQLSVICSVDMAERQFFEDWMRYIVRGSSFSGTQNQDAGLLNFYSRYARGNILSVEQLDENGNTLMTYAMKDIYPIALSPMNATWEENNTYQRFEVTMTYREHLGYGRQGTVSVELL